MHQFHWVPANHQRHASTDTKTTHGNYPTGTSVGTLCDRQLHADNTELAWLWPTCPDCNTEAHNLAKQPNSTPTTATKPQQPARSRMQ